MSIQGIVHAAPPHATGFDTDTQLTSSTAQAFVNAGFAFAIRYLSRNTPEAAGDLCAQEAEDILSAGLALMAVQHVSPAGWSPTAQLGEQYGQNAATNAQSVGLPVGMNIWLDLEGVSPSCTSQNVTAYCNAWLNAVSAAGYLPGIYIGYDAGLDGEQLDALPVTRLWKSGSEADSADSYPATGYCMLQSISSSYVLDGVTYDQDVIQPDNMGNTPAWLMPKPSRVPILPRPVENAPIANSGSAGRIASYIVTAVLAYGAGAYTGPLLLAPNPIAQLVAPAPVPKPVPATGAHTHTGPASHTGSVAAAPAPATNAPERYLIVASFSDIENAARLAQTLQDAGYGTTDVTDVIVNGQLWHAVHLGPFPDADHATLAANQLREKYRVQPSLLPLK